MKRFSDWDLSSVVIWVSFIESVGGAWVVNHKMIHRLISFLSSYLSVMGKGKGLLLSSLEVKMKNKVSTCESDWST